MPITIGSIGLRGFEIPSAIRYGSSQRTIVHRLGDGSRVVEALGHEETTIEFSGVLSGPDAGGRAKALDEICQAGVAVPLVWDDTYREVLVKNFDARYMSPTWVPYRVACEVARLRRSANRDAVDASSGIEAVAPVDVARLPAGLREDVGALAGEVRSARVAGAGRIVERSVRILERIDALPVVEGSSPGGHPVAELARTAERAYAMARVRAAVANTAFRFRSGEAV